MEKWILPVARFRDIPCYDGFGRRCVEEVVVTQTSAGLGSLTCAHTNEDDIRRKDLLCQLSQPGTESLW